MKNVIIHKFRCSQVEEGKEILNFLHSLSSDTYVNIMEQVRQSSTAWFYLLHGILKLPSHVSHSVLLAVSAQLQSGDGRTESQGWIHKVGRTGGF